jgi:hypothetical protein
MRKRFPASEEVGVPKRQRGRNREEGEEEVRKKRTMKTNSEERMEEVGRTEARRTKRSKIRWTKKSHIRRKKWGRKGNKEQKMMKEETNKWSLGDTFWSRITDSHYMAQRC